MRALWGVIGGFSVLSGCAAHHPAAETAPDRGFTVVEIRPVSGQTLGQQLVTQAERAQGLSLAPILELTSPWCHECFVLDHTFDDPHMREALKGTYIIRMDVMRWAGRYGETGLGAVTMALPSFVQLFDNGRGIGQFVDARSWVADAPGTVAPSLGAFVRSVEDR